MCVTITPKQAAHLTQIVYGRFCKIVPILDSSNISNMTRIQTDRDHGKTLSSGSKGNTIQSLTRNSLIAVKRSVTPKHNTTSITQNIGSIYYEMLSTVPNVLPICQTMWMVMLGVRCVVNPLLRGVTFTIGVALVILDGNAAKLIFVRKT